MKKAAIYDPYLDTLGGGERYCLTVAEILSKNGYHVDLLWDKDSDILTKAETRFSLDLSSVKITNDFFKQSPTNIDLFEDDLQTAKKYSKTLSVGKNLPRRKKRSLEKDSGDGNPFLRRRGKG